MGKNIVIAAAARTPMRGFQGCFKEVSAFELGALARIVGHAPHSRRPSEFTIALIEAVNKLLTKVGWNKSEVDLFGINEAFDMVTMPAIRELDLDGDKVNIHSGACAQGHPIGSTGARIIGTLIHALRKLAKKPGIAALCIGGGEATALAVELLWQVGSNIHSCMQLHFSYS